MTDATTPPTSPTTPDAPVVPPVTPEPAPVGIAEASEQLAKLGEGWQGLTRDEQGRLHRPDGTFASEEEVKAHQQANGGEVEVVAEPSEPVSEPEPVEAGTEPTEEVVEPEPVEPEFTVVLKGHSDRGEEDLELVLPDAEAVERFNRAVNDGLRKKDYEAKLQTVAAKEAEVAEFYTALEHNPIGTMLNAIPREVQVQVAQALVAEHWDSLFPQLQQFAQDPTGVYKTRLEAREQAIAADRQARVAVEANQKAQAILTATEALVPDTVTPDIKAAFLADAERDLIALAQQGAAIAPSEVGSLLARRIQMYGFTQQDPARPSKPVVAKRVGTNPPKATPSVDQAKQVQARMQETAKVRKNAAAIPPAGRGPVATRKPLIPAGADIETASQALAKMTSWAEFRPV